MVSDRDRPNICPPPAGKKEILIQAALRSFAERTQYCSFRAARAGQLRNGGTKRGGGTGTDCA